MCEMWKKDLLNLTSKYILDNTSGTFSRIDVVCIYLTTATESFSNIKCAPMIIRAVNSDGLCSIIEIQKRHSGLF